MNSEPVLLLFSPLSKSSSPNTASRFASNGLPGVGEVYSAIGRLGLRRRMQQKMMCYIGSQSINPCPNSAVTKDAYGMAVCEEHRQIAEMGLEYDGYL